MNSGSKQMRQISSIIVVLAMLTGCTTTSMRAIIQEHDIDLDAMQIVGQAEYVTVFPSELKYRARIDSGATTCSISALDIENFERDGKKWVRFRMPLPLDKPGGKVKKGDELEYSVSRIASIKRHGAKDQLRPAVKMSIQLGKYKGLVEFTLTDRTKYEFPILVGRNLLEGNSLIDVSKSYIAEEN